MGHRFRPRTVAAVLGIAVLTAWTSAQAHDLTCTARGRDKAVPLRFSDDQRTAAFADEPAAPTTVTDKQIKWLGPTDARGYRPSYVFNRDTGTLIRTAPMMFNSGLTSMWPTTFDCGGRMEKVE